MDHKATNIRPVATKVARHQPVRVLKRRGFSIFPPGRPLPLLESPLLNRHEVEWMPEISRFFGIIIAMFYNDHAPPHFHVRYGSERALIAIETLSLLEGKLSPRALGLVMEWASCHQVELMEDWNLARGQTPLKPIEPLR